MSTRPFPLRCPQLDLLRRNLVDAYRSTVDDNLSAIPFDPIAMGNKLSLIHEAISQHRERCPICAVARVKVPRLDYVRQ